MNPAQKQLQIFNALPVELRKLISDTEQPFIKITANPALQPLPNTMCKFGGVPYLPVGCDYPKYNGKPLFLLAQINFADVFKAVGAVQCNGLTLPESGILQIFIASDDLYGLDYDQPYPESESCYQVRFWENSDQLEDAELVAFAKQAFEKFKQGGEDDDGEEILLPFHREFSLKFQRRKSGITSSDISLNTDSDYNCQQQFDEYYYSLNSEERNDIWNNYSQAVSEGGHKLLGYASFAQLDPRQFNDGKKLLLQIDTEFFSEHPPTKDDICWGDMGVGNFFITADDLANKCFDRLMYNWDCG